MVNGRTLECELKKIDEFFDALSVEEFEKIAFDCGAGVISSSYKSKYVEAASQRYRNVEHGNKLYASDAVFPVTTKETEAA